MPAALLQSFAKRARIPMDRAERLWDKAKAQVTKEYKIDEPKGGKEATRYWKLVVGIVKKMMRLESAAPPAIDAELVEELRRVGLDDVADSLQGS